jgi:hypothetical protein
MKLWFTWLILVSACASAPGPSSEEELAAFQALTGTYEVRAIDIYRALAPAPGESGPCLYVNGAPTCSGLGGIYAVLVTSDTILLLDPKVMSGSFPETVTGQLQALSSPRTTIYRDYAGACGDEDLGCFVNHAVTPVRLSVDSSMSVVLRSDGRALASWRLSVVPIPENPDLTFWLSGPCCGYGLGFAWELADRGTLTVQDSSKTMTLKIRKLE